MDRSISSGAKREMMHLEVFNTDDWISKIPDDLLLKILTRLSTEEVIRTSVLSKRWLNVWKETSNLCLNMRKIAKTTVFSTKDSHDAARTVTKVIKDHRGHLERCSIYHDIHQCENGVLESWIQSLVHVKHIKHLTLGNFSGRLNQSTRSHIGTLDLPPKSFSHPDLISLLLCQYNLETPHAFYNCWSLKDLRLFGISAEIGVLNAVLVSCTSLEVLQLKIICPQRGGFLNIENHNLKFLYLFCSGIEGINVSSPRLDVISIEYLSFDIENFVIASPRFHFHRNYWATGKCIPNTSIETSVYSHTSYNIACPHQGEENIGHEIMMSGSNNCMKMSASMSVSVDLTNAKEVEMLREVLVAWPADMGEVEIVFKSNNSAREESESSIGKTRNMLWEETNPFPNAQFHAFTVWLSNFSGSNQEFALASSMITQGMVVKMMMIRPLSSSPTKKVEIEAAIVELKKLPKFHKELIIVMF